MKRRAKARSEHLRQGRKSELNDNISLGLIETLGLIGAVEAADAACKEANVKLVGYDLATGGLVTIKLIGDLASVQVAVETGARRASKVGKLISAHVIARPYDDIIRVFKLAAEEPLEREKTSEEDKVELEAKTVRELRKIARRLDNISLTGREISRAKKSVLIEEVLKAKFQE